MGVPWVDACRASPVTSLLLPLHFFPGSARARLPSVDVGIRVEGLKAQRLAIKRDRFGKLSLVQESIAQVDERLDVVGVELLNQPKALGGIAILFLVHEDDCPG